MPNTQTNLSFINPPIREVAYSFQFEPIPKLHLGYLGLLWGSCYQSDFPNVEHDDPLEHDIERFGSKFPAPQRRPLISLMQSIPVPRLRFVSEDQNTLLQLQNDMFVFNWRRMPGANTEYPRFPVLNEMFNSNLSKLEGFLQLHNLPQMTINQVSITNVNHIPAKGKSLSEVFRGFTCNDGMHQDLREEGFGVLLRDVILFNGDPIGRLYLNIQKKNRMSDGTEIFTFELTARARPIESSRSGAFETLALLRNHINLSFSSLTTPEIQTVWGREGV